MVPRRHILRFVICGLVFAGVVVAQAPDDLEGVVVRGIGLVAHHPELAVDFLAPAFDLDPGYVSARAGSVAWGLGRALNSMRRHDEALRVLEAGLREQLRRSESEPGAVIDPLLLDEYADLVHAEHAEFDHALATAAFLGMFRNGTGTLSEVSQKAFLRYLVASELLMEPEDIASGEYDRRAAAVLAWWRRHDRTPADSASERVVSHLSRIARARAQFGEFVEVAGMDARAVTYIRYGEPSSRGSINLREGDFIQTVIYRGLPVRPRDFPINEVWSYRHIDPSGVYIFVEQRDGSFTLGGVNDLVPRQLSQRAGGHSERAEDAQHALLQTLRFILGTLSLHHRGFGSRYVEVTNDLEREEQRRISRNWDRPDIRIGRLTDAQAAGMSAIGRNHEEDHQLAKERQRVMPSYFYREEAVALPVNARAIRFLEEGRSTGVRVIWEVDEAQRPRECRQVPGSEGLTRQVRLLSLPPEPRSGPEIVAASNAHLPNNGVLTGWTLGSHDPGPHSAALQIDERPEGARVSQCTGLAWMENLVPLTLSAGIELSDLLPFRVTDVVESRVQLAGGLSAAELSPYVSSTLAGQSAIGVYFEVYSATDLNADYLIEYQVVKRTREGVLQRGRTETSVFHAARGGLNHRLPAALLVDAAEWRGARTVDIVVTVTNLETSQERTRTLTFSVES